MTKQPVSEEPAEDPVTDGEDTEGQSMGALIAMRELTKRERPTVRQTDETLPRLTKSFPRMRDDSKK
jgi:hypothetical protein